MKIIRPLTLLLAIHTTCFGQGGIPLQQFSLQGLDSLCVAVDVPSTLSKYGISSKELELYAWEILSEGGLMVLSGESLKTISGMPFVHVSFNATINEDERLAVYKVDMRLFQQVIFQRNPSIRATNSAAFYAVTWMSSQGGSIGTGLLWETKQTVVEFLEKLVNDRLSVTGEATPVGTPLLDSLRLASYGYTQTNPIKVGGFEEDMGPKNESSYLESLRDSAGEEVEFTRLGREER